MRFQVAIAADNAPDTSESEDGDDAEDQPTGAFVESDDDTDNPPDSFYYIEPRRADVAHLLQHVQMHRRHYMSILNLSESAIDSQVAWLNAVRHDLAEGDKHKFTTAQLASAFSFAEVLMEAAGMPHSARIRLDELRGFLSDVETLDSEWHTYRTEQNFEFVAQALSTTPDSTEVTTRAHSTVESTAHGKKILDRDSARSVAAAVSTATTQRHNREIDSLKKEVRALKAELRVATSKGVIGVQGPSKVSSTTKSIIKTSKSPSSKRRVSFGSSTVKIYNTDTHLSDPDDDNAGIATTASTANILSDTTKVEAQIANDSFKNLAEDDVDSAISTGGEDQSDPKSAASGDNENVIDTVVSDEIEKAMATPALTHISQQMQEKQLGMNPGGVVSSNIFHPAMEVIGAGDGIVNGVYARIGNHKGKPRYRKLGLGPPQRITLTRNEGEAWGLALTSTTSRRGPVIIKKVLEGSVASRCSAIQPSMPLIEINGFLTAGATNDQTITEVLRRENTIHVVVGGGAYDGWFECNGKSVEIRWDWNMDLSKDADYWPNECDHVGFWIGLGDGVTQQNECYYYNPRNAGEVPELGWELTGLGHNPAPRISHLTGTVVDTELVHKDSFLSYLDSSGKSEEEDVRRAVNFRTLGPDDLVGWLELQGANPVATHAFAVEQVGGQELGDMLSSEDGRAELQHEFGLSEDFIGHLIVACQDVDRINDNTPLPNLLQLTSIEVSEYLCKFNVSQATVNSCIAEGIDGVDLANLLKTDDGRGKLQRDHGMSQATTEQLLAALKDIADGGPIVVNRVHGEKWGMALKTTPAGPVIAKLAPGLACSREPRLKVGTSLHKINGQDVTKKSMAEIQMLLSQATELVIEPLDSKTKLQLLNQGKADGVTDFIEVILRKGHTEKWGLGLAADAQGPFISRISPGGAASRNVSLLIGQRVLKLGGHDVTSADVLQIGNIMLRKHTELEVVVSCKQPAPMALADPTVVTANDVVNQLHISALGQPNPIPRQQPETIPKPTSRSPSRQVELSKTTDTKWGLTFSRGEFGIVIAKINPSGAAFGIKGLQIGDSVLAVGEQDTTGESMTTLELAAAIRSCGNHLRLTLGSTSP